MGKGLASPRSPLIGAHLGSNQDGTTHLAVDEGLLITHRFSVPLLGAGEAEPNDRPNGEAGRVTFMYLRHSERPDW